MWKELSSQQQLEISRIMNCRDPEDREEEVSVHGWVGFGKRKKGEGRDKLLEYLVVEVLHLVLNCDWGTAYLRKRKMNIEEEDCDSQLAPE